MISRAAWAALMVMAAPMAQAAIAAVLIDDLGYSRERARRVLALPPPVSVAVLPDARYAAEVARAARRSGRPALVHMPMAADGGRAGAGALEADMSAAAIRDTLEGALAAVPGAVGVNNHRGSALTADRAAMDRFMRELARRGRDLIFIDSRTSTASRAVEAAERAGIGVAERDVFLDHVRDEAAIARQAERWLTRARETGCALAIGHPHPETLAVLERELARAQGVERVGIRTYVHRCGTPRPGGKPWHVSSYPSPTAAKSSRPSP